MSDPVIETPRVVIVGAGLGALYAALKLDESIPTTTKLAGEYKNLEITFAELKKVGPTRALPQFEEDFRAAKARLEAANAFAYFFSIADFKSL